MLRLPRGGTVRRLLRQRRQDGHPPVCSDGTTAFTKTALGVYSYTLVADGLLTRSIADVDATTSDVETADSPSGVWGWSLPTAGTGLRIITQYTYDRQGRLSTTTLPTGRVTKTIYTRLSDQRPAVVTIPRVASGNWYGPLSYSVANQAGRGVFSGVIALSSPVSDGTAVVDTTASDPITAKLVGTLSRVRGQFYTADGAKLSSSRLYTTLPSTMAATSGYDQTTYTYDDMGRVIRTLDATGTISRTVYSTRGMPLERSIGTNDNGLTGGSSSGASNMTDVEKLEYDGGNSNGQGNGLLTKRTQDADGNWGGTSDQRVSEVTYDFRNRPVIQKNPASPHALLKYDNLGRVVAAGQYSTTSGLSVSSDPAATTSSNRLGLSETFFDERGMVWKGVRHEIVQSSGNKGGALTSQSWFDEDGRLVKSTGGQISKATYDRLGRPTGRYVVESSDDGTTYANAKTVTGDAVVEESHTGYEALTGRALLTWSIKRPHRSDFWTTGPLDSNADNTPLTVSGGDVFGRVQISATWYDAWDRPLTSANYGSYNIAADNSSSGTNFDRASITTPPTFASSNVLVTAMVYDDEGMVKDVVDPKGRTQRTLYDTAGRRVSVAGNYTDGTVGGGSDNDQDRITEYTYAAGGMVATVTQKMTGAGNDQTTTYTYGVVKSGSTSPLTDSQHASNRALAYVTYPEQSGGQSTADRSTYHAYNALGQGVWVRDPSGNIIQTTYDTAGRPTVRTASTIVSPFDATVASIHTTYDNRGMVSLLSQKNSSSTVLNELSFAYDDWGNVQTYKQDPDSAIGGGTGRADYSLTWTYALSTPSTVNDGWQRVRLNSFTHPDGSGGGGGGQSVSLTYDTPNTHLTTVTMSSVPLASYQHLGVQTPVYATLEETDFQQQGVDSGSFANYHLFMDRWNRPTKVVWVRGGVSTPALLVNQQIAYDEAGLPKFLKDFTAKDAAAGDRNFDQVNLYDGLRRLIKRSEGEANSGGTAITSGKESREEVWTRDVLSRITTGKVDLTGNTTYTEGTIAAKDGGEMDDTRTFNKRNRPTARSYYDKDNVGTPKAATLTYDKNDNLTSDGEKYDYVYNPWCQLVAVKVYGTATTVARYTYNALGQRLSEQDDRNANGTVSVKWKAKGNAGSIYLVFRKLAGNNTFAQIGFSSKKSFVDGTVPAGTVSCQYQVQAVRGNQVSTASQPVTVQFGAGGAVGFFGGNASLAA